MASRQSRSVSQHDPNPNPAPSRHLEVETKLEIGDDVPLPTFAGRRSLVAAGLQSVADPVVFELDAVYFDTFQLDLLRSKLTLRRRTGGEDAGWHLKLPAAAGARTEIGLPLEPGTPDPLAAVVPAVLADVVQGAARGRDLRPVARIRNRRTVRRLLDATGEPMVEVADDRVTSTTISRVEPDAGTATATVEGGPTQWRELEVELVAGTRDQLAVVVGVLQAAGATTASSASKLGRALGQHVGDPGKRSKTAGAFVVTALGRLRDSLIATDRALREETDSSLHDARAAARRIRSVLGIYRSLFAPGATRELRGDLQRYGLVLGPARDLEVLRRRLAGQLVDEPSEYAAAAQSRIDAEMATAVPGPMAALQQYIRSQSYLLMLRQLDGFLADPPFSARAAKAGSSLAVPLSTTWSELVALVAQVRIDQAGKPDFHEVRKAAKALRYASEAASPILGADTVVFAAAVEEIQEVLGERQDSMTAAAWLAGTALRPDTDGVAGFTFGRLHAFEQAVAQGTIDDFADAWDRLADGELARAAVGWVPK